MIPNTHDNLKLKDILFGSLDANNEYTNDAAFFKKSFLFPKNFNESDFLDGRKYFILGPKGSGKTALLNYYKDLLQSKGKLCKNIFYKSDINDDVKDTFLLELDKLDLNSMTNDEISALNFENLWQLYFHQKIVTENPQFINHDRNWTKYVKEVNKLDQQHTFSLENIKHIVNAHLGSQSAGLSTSTAISWKHNEQRMKYNNLAYTIKQLFLKLTINKHNKTQLFFLTDELELNRLDEKRFRRDVAMIRDLIIAIHELNLLSTKIGNPIRWIAAIRTEVVNSMYSTGKEINKPLSDNGETLNWELNGGNNATSPIIEMLLKKIQASEQLHSASTSKNINTYSSDVQLHELEKILKRYFTDTVSIPYKSQSTVSYIIRQTFLLPRDIVRLFNIIKKKYPEKVFFSQPMFEGVRSQYSQNTWTEISEELTAKYSPQDLDAIERLLQMSSNSPFSVDEFHQLAKKNRTPSIKQLVKNKDLDEILSDLYDINVIGNLNPYNQKIRFSYRGQTNLNYDQDCIVHDSIRKTLS
ncbi:hypothetical protein AB8Z00_12760 (plasmid) [Levilactobacillus brevis]|uniref:P-loop ATPase, Sll1717 family n=1 Tax=Levilactobacillus brevis TaxID=1580 RepID=UPI00350FBD74